MICLMQMSDPLTALMHAVQVMNLLKTLITKTLREREEVVTEGNYSPMSSHSSGQESDEEYNSQQEMDTSCESRGPGSDCDESADYNHNEEYEHEDEGDSLREIGGNTLSEIGGGSLREIEECFLRQLDRNKIISNRQDEAETVNSDSNSDSGERNTFDSKSLSERYESVKDVEMDQLVETASSMPLLVNS